MDYIFQFARPEDAGGVFQLHVNRVKWMDSKGPKQRNATAPTEKGTGHRLLEEAKKMAIRHGKHFIRIDCAVDNPVLNDYYRAMGYETVCKCTHGPHVGNLRQKAC